MKTSIVLAFASLSIAASCAAANPHPQPSSAPAIPIQVKRQDATDASGVLSQFSAFLTDPLYSSVAAQLSTNPAFLSTVSARLASVIGSKSAAEALSEYKSVLSAAQPGGATTTAGGSAAGSSSVATQTPTTVAASSVSNGANRASPHAAAALTYMTLAAVGGVALVMGAT